MIIGGKGLGATKRITIARYNPGVWVIACPRCYEFEFVDTFDDAVHASRAHVRLHRYWMEQRRRRIIQWGCGAFLVAAIAALSIWGCLRA